MWSPDPKLIEMLRRVSDPAFGIKQINAQLTEAFGSLEKAAEALRQVGEATSRSINNAAEIGRHGWTIPLWMTIADINHAYDSSGGTKEGLDAYYRRYYSTDQGQKYLVGLFEALLQSETLRPWQPLISECISSFTDKRFLVAVPALFTVLEGAFVTSHGRITTKDKPKLLARRVKETQARDLSASFDLNMIEFILAVFGDSDWSKTEPDLINRNWVLHGRSNPSWPEEDSIRLFQALEFWTLS